MDKRCNAGRDLLTFCNTTPILTPPYAELDPGSPPPPLPVTTSNVSDVTRRMTTERK